MKFTLNWLKDHLETSASLEEINIALTALGLEVESITNHAEKLKDFVVAEILETEPHPQADKLRYCKVSDGSQILQIVCGAPNARAGLKTVLAREGVYVPGADFTIKKTKIRGLESCGMMCSFDELGIEGDSDGIIELPADAITGSSATAAMGLDDVVIEIAITPNRGDCLGVRGIARDLAATGIGHLKPLIIEQEMGSFKPSISVSIETIEHCPKFLGCEIRGVKNGASPEWLQRRLRAIGLRPISTLVDVTNYINFNLGRPSHVYDADKLNGNIIVRHAKDGEVLKALNGKDYTLQTGMTVIADEKNALGIAGIMGGEASGCTEETENIFLEVALFDPINIAQTGRKLDILSDARYRFERGVDPASVVTGAELAVRMITTLCGGKVSEWVVAGKVPQWQHTISFAPERVATLGGISLSNEVIASILHKLGFHFEENTLNKVWEITPPSWRADIEGEADIVEEILRVYGYDNLPITSLPPASQPQAILDFLGQASALARRALASRGFMEAHSWAFMHDSVARLFAPHQPALMLANPISSELNYMRPSIVPNLLDAAKRNRARGTVNLLLCEVGAQFEGLLPDQQRQVATALRTGDIAVKSPHNDARQVDVFDAKADALAVLAASGFDTGKIVTVASAPDYYHPGRSGTLSLGGKITLAYFGELHPLVLQKMDYKSHAVACEVFLDKIPAPKQKSASRPALQVSDYQAVERDFAFLANDNVLAGDILKTIRTCDNALIRDVRIFDIYKGSNIEPGKQSIAVSVTLQANDRTLTDEEIEAVAKKVIDAAAKQFGGVLRN